DTLHPVRQGRLGAGASGEVGGDPADAARRPLAGGAGSRPVGTSELPIEEGRGGEDAKHRSARDGMSLHVFANIVTPYGTAANNHGETEGNVTTLQKLIWMG